MFLVNVVCNLQTATILSKPFEHLFYSFTLKFWMHFYCTMADSYCSLLISHTWKNGLLLTLSILYSLSINLMRYFESSDCQVLRRTSTDLNIKYLLGKIRICQYCLLIPRYSRRYTWTMVKSTVLNPASWFKVHKEFGGQMRSLWSSRMQILLTKHIWV